MTDEEIEALLDAELRRLTDAVKPLLGLPVKTRDPEAFLRAYLSALALRGAATLLSETLRLRRPEAFEAAMAIWEHRETRH